MFLHCNNDLSPAFSRAFRKIVIKKKKNLAMTKIRWVFIKNVRQQPNKNDTP